MKKTLEVINKVVKICEQKAAFDFTKIDVIDARISFYKKEEKKKKKK